MWNSGGTVVSQNVNEQSDFVYSVCTSAESHHVFTTH
jgi:hypothetical protein